MARKKKKATKKEDRYWLQEAKERMERKGTVGKFTAYCKRKGYKGVTQECINEAKREARETGNIELLREAVFAQNVRKIAKKKKKKKKK